MVISMHMLMYVSNCRLKVFVFRIVFCILCLPHCQWLPNAAEFRLSRLMQILPIKLPSEAELGLRRLMQILLIKLPNATEMRLTRLQILPIKKPPMNLHSSNARKKIPKTNLSAELEGQPKMRA